MKTLIDEYTSAQDFTDRTIRFFDAYIQKQRQPHCEANIYRQAAGEDAMECGATADGFHPTFGWLCRTCAERLEVKIAEA